jgi:hypothetical protein
MFLSSLPPPVRRHFDRSKNVLAPVRRTEKIAMGSMMRHPVPTLIGAPGGPLPVATSPRTRKPLIDGRSRRTCFRLDSLLHYNVGSPSAVPNLTQSMWQFGTLDPADLTGSCAQQVRTRTLKPRTPAATRKPSAEHYFVFRLVYILSLFPIISLRTRFPLQAPPNPFH